jgi:hypothetical protein
MGKCLLYQPSRSSVAGSARRRLGRLILALALSQFLEFPPLALQFGLVGIDLPLLVSLLDVLPLKLIAHQGTGAQAENTTNRSARAGMTHSRSDNSTSSGTAQSTYTGTFFPSGQATPSTPGDRREK